VPTRLTTNGKYTLGVVSSAGNLYLIPHFAPSPLEYNPRTKRVTLLSAPPTNVTGAQYAGVVLLPNDTIYGFQLESPFLLEIKVEGQYIAVYNHAYAKWNACGRIPHKYRLRPFALQDGTSVVFHTGGLENNDADTFTPFAIFDSKGIVDKSDRLPAYGPGVGNSVASYNVSAYDDEEIRTYKNNLVNTLVPGKGALAGSISSTGNADVNIQVTNKNLLISIGNVTQESKQVFQQIYSQGKTGMFASMWSNATNTAIVYLGDSTVGSNAATSWTGNTDNAFRIGGVNRSQFAGAFSGTVSELVVFTSDQQARESALADSSTSFFNTPMPKTR
jgi:hypothetical protein